MFIGDYKMGYSRLSFPKNTRVLVTGGAGFIGSNICEAILSLGGEVICLDNLSTGRMDNINHLLPNRHFKFIEGDVQNYNTCLEATKNIDYVIHQAAWGSVPRSIEMPLFYELNNVSGTLNIFDASKKNGVKKVVFASSSSVYGDSDILPKKEGHEGNVLSPYALTKKIDEEYARLFYLLYGLPTIGLRYFNVFGKRQNPNGQYAAVIPKFIKDCLNNNPSIINGDGTYSRDFTYVENVVEANIKACLLSDERSYGKSFNIAFGGRVTIKELYDTICSILNCENRAVYGSIRKGDIPHSNADISLAKACFNYSPDYSFYDGIKLAINWYKDNI